jgi:hypothetical protein
MQTTTRKGLPLPELADTSAMTFNVGPTGRQISTSGVVRDYANAISHLLDGFTEYNQDEPIPGRWEFQAPIIVDNGIGQLFTNRTGATRAVGDVVVFDPSNDQSVILPTAANYSGSKVGIVAESINNNAVGRVVFLGLIRVKVAGGVGRGQFLQTQSGSVIAAGSSLCTNASFAIAVTNADGVPSVLALLHPGATESLTDPVVTNQVTISSGAYSLPTVVGNTYRWRYTKAWGGTLTVSPAAGEQLVAPGATAASAVNASYASPNGESLSWYCHTNNLWYGL